MDLKNKNILVVGLARTGVSVARFLASRGARVTVTACSTEEGVCDQYAKCNVRDPLWRVRERIAAALDECTIAELAADIQPPVPTTRAAVLHTHL